MNVEIVLSQEDIDRILIWHGWYDHETGSEEKSEQLAARLAPHSSWANLIPDPEPRVGP